MKKKKIFGTKIPESSKKQNLNLLDDGNCLHRIYIVFTTICISLYYYLVTKSYLTFLQSHRL